MQPLFNPETDTLSGTLFAGKYQILRKIGIGGMGAVYLALDVWKQQTVAVKIVHARYAESDPACLQRFHTEARASSRLAHPNVMTAFDFGITAEGSAYLVMDYIPGEGLDEVLQREKRLDAHRASHIFLQACYALAHAHDQGVIHRDLKPGDFMLVEDDRGTETLKIVDFGIAKLLPGRTQTFEDFNDDGEIIGSPLYMSPEQCLGDPQDERSDIYSLGCLFYETLVGEPPISDRNVLSIIYRHLNDAPRRFASVAPQLSIHPQIEAVALKALQKRPEDRYQNMREMAADLKRALQASHNSLHSMAITYQGLPSLGNARSESVEDDQTAANLRELLKSATATYGANDPRLVPFIHELAEHYAAKKLGDRAEKYFRRAVHIMVTAYGAWDARIAETVKKLADFYRDSARYSEAEPLYFDLLDIKREAIGEKHPDIQCIMLRIADMYLAMHRLEEAKATYSECLALAEKFFGEYDPVLTPILNGLATVLRMQSDSFQAEQLYSRVLTIKELQFGSWHAEIANTLVSLGVLHRHNNRFRDASMALGRALTIYEQTFGAYDQQVCTILLLLAELYSTQGLDADAERLFKKALAIRQSTLESDDLKIADAYEMFAAHYVRRNNFEKAKALYGHALSIKERKLGQSHSQVAASMLFLATVYHAQQQYDQAEQYYRRAMSIIVGDNNINNFLVEGLRAMSAINIADNSPAYTMSQTPTEPFSVAIVNSLANMYSAANGMIKAPEQLSARRSHTRLRSLRIS